MAAHRYWRIQVFRCHEAGGDTAALAFTNIEMRATFGGPDQCSGGVATASSTYTIYTASNAFDVDEIYSQWHASVALPQWIAYEFSLAVEVTEIALRIRNDCCQNRGPRNFRLEYSDNGVDWFVRSYHESLSIWALGEERVFQTPVYDQKITHTLQNPDFETPNSGWSTEVNPIEWVWGGNWSIASYSGNYHAQGSNDTSFSRAFQNIDVVTQGVSTARIDNGQALLRMLWFYASYYTDAVRGGFRFYDSVGGLISEYWQPEPVPYGNWEEKFLEYTMPVGTRTVDIAFEFIRNSGSNNNGFLDLVSLETLIDSSYIINAVAANFLITGHTAHLQYSRQLTYLETTLTMGATRFWRLGDIPEGGSASVAVEEIVGDDGTYEGTVEYANSLIVGDVNAAARFKEAELDYVTTPYRRYLMDRTLKTTIVTWIKCEEGEGGIFGGTKRENGNVGNVNFGIHAVSGLPYIICNYSTALPYSIHYYGNEPIPKGVPVQLVFVLDEYTYRIYMDGKLELEVLTAYVEDTADSANSLFEIGRSYNHIWVPGYFEGVCDEVTVFEDVLTEAQVNELFLAGNGGKYILRCEHAQYSFNGYPSTLDVDASVKILADTGEFSFTGESARLRVIKNTDGTGDGTLQPFQGAAQQTPDPGHMCTSDPIWYEGVYPPAGWQCAPGSFPKDWDDSFFKCKVVDYSTLQVSDRVLIGEFVRNDIIPMAPRTHDGTLVSHAHIILSGCEVLPREILYDGSVAGDQHFTITVSNNDVGRSLLVERMTLLENGYPAQGMEILEANTLPYTIPPYTFVQFTLVIYGNQGNQRIDAILEVRVGTCDTDIPITGTRDIECPICPPVVECPPIIEIPEDYNMAQCMIPQHICAITRGDRFPFNVVFTRVTGLDEEGNKVYLPINIGGKTLVLELRKDVKQTDPDISIEKLFPIDEDSTAGKSDMALTPTETWELEAGRTYCFKFRLENGPSQRETIGRGTIPVNPDPVEDPDEV